MPRAVVIVIVIVIVWITLAGPIVLSRLFVSLPLSKVLGSYEVLARMYMGFYEVFVRIYKRCRP